MFSRQQKSADQISEQNRKDDIDILEKVSPEIRTRIEAGREKIDKAFETRSPMTKQERQRLWDLRTRYRQFYTWKF